MLFLLLLCIFIARIESIEILQTLKVSSNATVVMAMMVRDEAVNLASNLPLWAEVCDYFVILVDERTVDDSYNLARDILTKYSRKFILVMYSFEGFGEARTLSLNYAWNTFSNASHVLIADPDWRPDLATINKSELDDSADVFRFTVFDRNGVTRRRIDWLLKHRSGLRMRYSLHEVLDIGNYVAKPISWVVAEIEQLGTWHATVGHGHSHAISRYEFDLSMLHRDLIRYPNDPHVDYYFGITYYALAEGIFRERNYVNHTAVNGAVKYLLKRLYSTYTDEFIEERWAAMFTLGGLYFTFHKDMERSVQWFSACRDYNPSQAECSLQLMRVYLASNRFDLAEQELDFMFRQEPQERLMLNMLHTHTCAVPTIVLEMGRIKFQHQLLSIGESWSLLAMAGFSVLNKCNIPENEIREVVNITSVQLRTDTSILLSNIRSVCGSQELQSYLLLKNYKQHPCFKDNDELQLKLKCSPFLLTPLPPTEDLQSGTILKGYIGSAFLEDLVHHVYHGDETFVFRRTSLPPFRILFADYFDKRMVYQLVGSLIKRGSLHFEIVVVTSNINLYHSMKEELALCLSLLSPQSLSDIISLHYDNLVDYINSVEGTSRFDYIEYNGGISFDPTTDAKLNLFKGILTPTGSLGLTYFSDNVHVQVVQDLIASTNRTIFQPFSLETKNVIRNYLKGHSLGHFLEDRSLLTCLGAEPVERFLPPGKLDDVIPALPCRWFSHVEVTNILREAGFLLLSTLPSALSNPYEEIGNFLIFQHFASGLSPETFSYYYLPNFRKTIYAGLTKFNANLGRRKILETDFRNQSLLAQLFVIDRSGELTQLHNSSFSRRSSSIITIDPYRSDSNLLLFDMTIPAPIAIAISRFTSRTTVYDMLKEAERENRLLGKPLTTSDLEQNLWKLLRNLEMFNRITFSVNDDQTTALIGKLKEMHHSLPEGQSQLSVLMIDHCPRWYYYLSLLNTAHIRIYCFREEYHDFPFEAVTSLSSIPSPVDWIFTAQPTSQLVTSLLTSTKNLVKRGTVIVTDLCEGFSGIHPPKIGGVSWEWFPTSSQCSFNSLLVKKTPQDTSFTAPKTVNFQKKNCQLEVTIQSQHLLDLGFDQEFLQHFTSCTAPKPVENVEVASTLQTLLKTLKEKTAKLVEAEALSADVHSVENDLQQVITHSQLSARIPGPSPAAGKSVSSPLFRRKECWRSSQSDCEEMRPIRRKTAAIDLGSQKKFEFDSKQVDVLCEQSLVSPDVCEEFRKSVQKYSSMNLREKIFRTEKSSSHLNRLLHVQPDALNCSTDLFHSRVLEEMKKSASAAAEMDYFVFDDVFRDNVSNQLSAALLHSTIWFDITNGDCFASHHDDGLEVPSLFSMSQQLLFALFPTRTVQILKYFALTLSTGSTGDCPVILANRDEIAVVVFLTDRTSSDGGLLLYDTKTADCLFSNGVSKYPSVHPDFLSKSGSLKIDVAAKCPQYQSEYVTSKANRMVVIQSKSPFHLAVTKDSTASTDRMSENLLAFVVIARKYHFESV